MFERTFVLLKPDAFDEREAAGKIHLELEALGLKIVRFWVTHLDESQVRKHYAQYADKPFFARILAYMTRGHCSLSVWEGDGAVGKVRKLAGATRPDEADPASLRGRFGRVTPDGGIENVIHCSATPEEAALEIALFFGEPDPDAN